MRKKLFNEINWLRKARTSIERVQHFGFALPSYADRVDLSASRGRGLSKFTALMSADECLSCRPFQTMRIKLTPAGMPDSSMLTS